MKNYETYELTEAELDKISEVNPEGERSYKCSCAIQDNKPSFCQQGPLISLLSSGCGYYFEEVNGEIVRKGQCIRCGRCCSIPRKDGNPFGFFDPEGKACVHLRVEE